MSIKINKNLYTELVAIRPLIIEAAQKIYDNWDQTDEDSGGICDEVENAISSIISNETSAEETELGGQDGDDHAWTIVKKGNKIYGVDIPPSVYETGSGYSWKKRKNVKFEINDVDIFEIK